MVELFDTITQNTEDWSSDAVVSAMGFSSWLSRKSTHFFISLFSEIYGITDSLYDILQKKSLSIVFCNQSIADTIDALQQKLSNFERFSDSLKESELSNDSPIERYFDPKRLYEIVLNSVITKI